MRHFLRDDDLLPAEQAQILSLATELKADRFSARPLDGPQTVAILFDKPTLRTQLSFTVGVTELGGFPLVVDSRLAQVGVRESVADVARVIGPQVSAIVWRIVSQCWSSWRRTISQITPSPVPVRSSTSTVRSRTARM